jgi:hypothetical protein
VIQTDIFVTKIWGEAYGKIKQVPSCIVSLFQSPEYDLEFDGGTITSGDQWHGFFPSTAVCGQCGIEWPNALECPLFYIGIYTAISLMQALILIAAQYTGALKASRILFK